MASELYSVGTGTILKNMRFAMGQNPDDDESTLGESNEGSGGKGRTRTGQSRLRCPGPQSGRYSLEEASVICVKVYVESPTSGVLFTAVSSLVLVSSPSQTYQ